MIELLAPCGGMEQLQAALRFGADAVYFGAGKFSLRARVENFLDLGVACDVAHRQNKKAYVAMNAIVHPDEVAGCRKVARQLREAGADAVIVSDPGVLTLVKEEYPKAELHLSTQDSTCNQLSAAFWHEAGVKRIVLGRECTLKDIQAIRENTPASLELEAFVHGAMCMAYSGRCLLSAYFTGRSANCGDCAQPCRWKYQIVETTRPDEPMEAVQEGDETFLFSSRDLCMIEHLPDLLAAGVTSMKIEGRMKSAYYVGVTVRAYRKALDCALSGKPVPRDVAREVFTTSHREYTTGFYYGNPLDKGQQYGSSGYIRDYDFCGVVLACKGGRMLVEQRNKFQVGEALELVSSGEIQAFTVLTITDEQGNSQACAPHPQQRVYMNAPSLAAPQCFLRRKRGDQL